MYILGAGFSKDAGLPVVNEFMEKMRDARGRLATTGEQEEELRAIDAVLAFRNKSKAAAEHVPLNLENVEELFSLASTATGQEGVNLRETR